MPSAGEILKEHLPNILLVGLSKSGHGPDFTESGRAVFGLSEDWRRAIGKGRGKELGRLDTGRKREIEDTHV